MEIIICALLSSFIGNTPVLPIHSVAGFTQTNPVEYLDKKDCTLSITGYGYIEGAGKVEVTLTATGSTCDAAAAELRPQIIAMQLRIQ